MLIRAKKSDTFYLITRYISRKEKKNTYLDSHLDSEFNKNLCDVWWNFYP